MTHHEELRRRFIPDDEVYTASGTIAGVLVEVELSGERPSRFRPRPG